LLVFCCAASVHADEDDPWKARDSVIFGMPFLYQIVQPGNSGVITSLLETVYAPDNLDFIHKPLPYVRILEALKKGNIHCTLALKDRIDGVLQGDVTVVTYDIAVAHLRTTPFAGVQSLAGRRVAARFGFGLSELLGVPFQYQPIYALSSGFHMLDRDHVKFVLGDRRLLRHAMWESHLSPADFLFDDIGSYEVRVIFAPTEKGRRFLEIFNSRMKELRASGEIQTLMLSMGVTEADLDRILKLN